MEDFAHLLLALVVILAPLGLAWWWLSAGASERRPPRLGKPKR